MSSMVAKDEIRQASDQFYAALNRLFNGDAGPMMEIRSHSPDVTVLHSVAGVMVGWEQVRASCKKFA